MNCIEKWRCKKMGCLGNFLWFIFGGAVSGLSWGLMGCLWCITVVGIPVGIQCFKFAALSFFPFGKEQNTKLKKRLDKIRDNDSIKEFNNKVSLMAEIKANDTCLKGKKK